MRVSLVVLSITLCFWLVSCEQNSNIPHEKHGVESSHASMQIKHLSMLLEHGISMMAQGAELKLQGNSHGDVMLSQSADMLRRAMSGSEMTAMHKGGQGQSPAMQHTHDLGAAAFDLLDMMMSLQMDKPPKNADILHHALNMAAQGASLKSLAIMGMSHDIDVFMQQHGMQMQQESLALSKTGTAPDVYQSTVLKVMDLLVSDASEPLQHMH